MSSWEVVGRLALISVSWTCGNAAAGELRDDEHRLPLVATEFDNWVDERAAEAKGSKIAMARKLHEFGFSCIRISPSVQFECVRFGCRKGLLGTGALLQWSIFKFDPPIGNGFEGTATDYSWLAGCYPESDTQNAQERFLARRKSGQ